MNKCTSAHSSTLLLFVVFRLLRNRINCPCFNCESTKKFASKPVPTHYIVNYTKINLLVRGSGCEKHCVSCINSKNWMYVRVTLETLFKLLCLLDSSRCVNPRMVNFHRNLGNHNDFWIDCLDVMNVNWRYSHSRRTQMSQPSGKICYANKSGAQWRAPISFSMIETANCKAKRKTDVLVS